MKVDGNALLASAKVWVRSASPAFDDEIADVIEACSYDLVNAGVSEDKAADYSNPLIVQAIKLYVKAFFGYEEESEKFSRAYEFLKKSLAISSDFREMA